MFLTELSLNWDLNPEQLAYCASASSHSADETKYFDWQAYFHKRMNRSED